MKNKKLMRAIAAMTMAAAMAGSVFVYTGCNAGDGDGGGGSNPPITNPQNYDITFNANGGKWGSDETKKVTTDDEGKVNVPANPTRADEPPYKFNFKGWGESPEATKTEDVASLTFSAAKTYYAVWEKALDSDKYDTISSSVNFKEAANELAGAETSAEQTVGTGGYTYGGKFFFSQGCRFEPGNNCVNTQKKEITITLGGIVNSIELVGKGASGTPGNLILKAADGTQKGTSNSTGNSAPVSITANDLPKGTYTIVSETSIRLTKISITEILEKSDPSGISVTPSKVDFLYGETFSTNGLTVVLNYENGRKDTLSSSDYTVEQSMDNTTAGKYTVTVKYKANSEFVETYDVYVYTIDQIESHTIAYESSKQQTLQQATVTGTAVTSDYLTVQGKGTVEGRTATFNLPKAALNITLPDVASEGEKVVNYSVKTEYATGGASFSGSYTVAVKNKIDVTENKVEITVGATGDFKTLTQAVQYLKACGYDAAVNKVIKVQAGTYTEKVWIDMDNVTLIGMGTEIDDTAISYSLVEGDKDAYSGSVWGLSCATVHVTGANFKAYHIAIRNDFDYIANHGKYSGSQAAQGLALTLDNKNGGSVLYDCHLFGNQDTLYMKSGRSYYYKTEIDGNVDFIFGGETSVAFFEECEIKAIDREKTTGEYTENGHVTAPQHKADGKPKYGYVFYKCNLTDDGEVNKGSMSLGRPWGAKATVSYIECSFSDAYAQTGTDSGKKINRWNDWNSSTTAENADYSEYGSKNSAGDPIMSEAVKGGKVLTQEQAALYTKANVFGTGNTTSYTTAWDSEAALTILKNLAGVQGG